MPPASQLRKALVTLDGVPLAGSTTITWMLQTGTQPYKTIYQVHKDDWYSKLKNKIGEPLVLIFSDAEGTTVRVRDVYILHQVASDSPHRVSFVVSDRRWLWSYKLVVRDYNIPRRTGDKMAAYDLPYKSNVTRDNFEYLDYSLNPEGERWTSKQAVEDILEELHDEEGDEGKKQPGQGGGKGGKKASKQWAVDSWPIESSAETQSEFSLQNITLRDQGDVALSRLLSYVPGAEVYIDTEGVARVFDGADINASDKLHNGLPPAQWGGEDVTWIDRAKIRPKEVHVHYQRELELMLEFSDDWSGQSSGTLYRSLPYIENVVQTVDPETTIETEFDPEREQYLTKTVRAGTWVRIDRWLAAMDKIKPEGSFPWTWKTVKTHWLTGDLEGAWLGVSKKTNDYQVAARIQAFKSAFRQIFRISRAYVQRARELKETRVGLIDTVTGARAPAGVWGQLCITMTKHGQLIAARQSKEGAFIYKNIDIIGNKPSETELVNVHPGPQRVAWVDKEIGIFRLDFIRSPYGTDSGFVPCNLVYKNGELGVATRDLSEQDRLPVGVGCRSEDGTNGQFLRDTLNFKVLLTAVPSAPNNANQFHRVVVKVDDLPRIFRSEFGITGGEGPPLELFIPPGEATARFAYEVEQDATETAKLVFGLQPEANNPKQAKYNKESLEQMKGFAFINEENEIKGHSQAVAVEALADFVSSLQGRTMTRIPKNGDLKLLGTVTSAGIVASSAPSAKIFAVHNFPGRQKKLSRFALLSESTRRIILGILPFSQGGKK